MNNISENFKGYDFLDFGCSTGANIKYMQKIVPSIRGLGIDIDQKKIDLCRLNGFNAINYDILKLSSEKIVRYVTMSHFLEHLPSVKIADAMIRKGIDVAREFIFIRQPWFDSDGFLLQNDLKFYWSDWRGHSNKMTSLDFYIILKKAIDLGVISGFYIYARAAVELSADNAIIPLSAGTDQHHFDASLHGTKDEKIKILPLAYKELVVVASVAPFMEMQSQIQIFLKPLGELILLKSVESDV